jgi:hypothetical protein
MLWETPHARGDVCVREQVPEDDAELEDEEAEKLQELMEADYDTGSVLKEKIVPRAVAWFTGEAIEMDDEDDEDDDDEGCVTSGSLSAWLVPRRE